MRNRLPQLASNDLLGRGLYQCELGQLVIIAFSVNTFKA